MIAILRPFAHRLLYSILASVTTRSAEDFGRFRRFRESRAAVPERVARALREAPSQSEAAFTRALQERRYELAWELLAPCAQRAWRDREVFVTEMAASKGMRIERSTLKSIRMLPSWQDPMGGEIYADVAEMEVEYHLRYRGRRTVVDKLVHLVHVEGGWKNLVYPPERLLHPA